MLVELANGLTERGHEVAVIMPPQGVIEYPLKVNVKRTRRPNITVGDIPKSDVIISNYYTLTSICEQASQSGKGVHVRLSLCYEPVFLPDHESSFKSYHTSKNLIVLSNWQKQLIQLNHGIEGEIVPVGVSKNFSNLGKRVINKNLEVSGILRIPDGGFSWHREQEYLMESFTALKHKYPNVTFNLITPPGEMSSPILRQFHSNPLFNSLSPKNDQQLNEYLNRTDIFVSSSTYDTASLPGLEAMKCGAALVTVYSGGNMDYCRHGQNCLLSYRYENKLVPHVSTLIENAQLRTKLIHEGEKEARKWTWERSVYLFEKAIQQFKSTS
ncbi:glycosyltransferase family 4 protein [Bacillus seohaeanensis]|jgi:glycosyltransferase involved in cell wall biosynthesis|uniref:Glycosyltransferase family 4 protein n=1 Tax=Bacillus seohaeanensis TaxID=284580 RepID=A0ABW5RXG4_9BACI